jgi:hypothetical protein
VLLAVRGAHSRVEDRAGADLDCGLPVDLDDERAVEEQVDLGGNVAVAAISWVIVAGRRACCSASRIGGPPSFLR